MGAPLEICSKRGVVAVLASGLVISLTALTGGIAPAFAQPDDDQVVTTTVMPEPEQTAPEPEEVAPEAPTTAPAPVVPETQAPPSAALVPATQAPQAPAAVEPEPETQAPAAPPSTAVAPPVTAVEPAEPSEAEESEPTTAERAPVTTTAPSAAAETPESAPATATASETAETSASSAPPSAALVPGSESSEAPTSSATETATSGATTTTETSAEASADESETPTVEIAQASKEIETVEPATVEAPAEDVQLAKAAKPIFEPAPAAAPEQDVAAFSSEIETSLKIPGLEIGASSKTQLGVGDSDVELVSQVRQWRPEWIEYDEFYRPIFMNPYRDPVRIVYMYEMRPRIMIIPPLARMVMEVAQYAAYSFTAAVLAPVVVAANVAQTLTNIAVGSFFGGGYFPTAGMAFPAPPPVLRYDNVPVFVNYAEAQYQPFRVRQIVDVGDDPQFGERKVLLDGATPAWGVWTQTSTGERQFEVHRTQQFPGLDAPAQGPLPGDYKLRLLSDSAPTGGLTGRDIFLMVAAGVIGTLGFGAIGLAFFLGRRRQEEV
jgi:hypothetical protein